MIIVWRCKIWGYFYILQTSLVYQVLNSSTFYEDTSSTKEQTLKQQHKRKGQMFFNKCTWNTPVLVWIVICDAIIQKNEHTALNHKK